MSKFIAAFDYIDKVLGAISVESDGVCIIFSVSVVGALIGIAGASFTLIFSLTTGIIKKLLSITRNKKKKHDKILRVAKSKLNSIETCRLKKICRLKKFLKIFFFFLCIK